MLHPTFDELREEGAALADGTPYPPLFNFTAEEYQLANDDETCERLVPAHARSEANWPPSAVIRRAAEEGRSIPNECTQTEPTAATSSSGGGGSSSSGSASAQSAASGGGGGGAAAAAASSASTSSQAKEAAAKSAAAADGAPARDSVK